MRTVVYIPGNTILETPQVYSLGFALTQPTCHTPRMGLLWSVHSISWTLGLHGSTCGLLLFSTLFLPKENYVSRAHLGLPETRYLETPKKPAAGGARRNLQTLANWLHPARTSENYWGLVVFSSSQPSVMGSNYTILREINKRSKIIFPHNCWIGPKKAELRKIIYQWELSPQKTCIKLKHFLKVTHCEKCI